ncbi:glycosyltransferase family 2 protein [Patiriisocius marinus]|uniref:glycosyltransferase family 2 protein n=1 Tax=Patiriisocius marinus TaxID=1397112 RepID=UPI00232D7423|nr:glycosyltransferase family 2 protein [Patiriisocius marinus]
MEQVKPLISIIIPTFNRGNVLAETLKSFQEQTFTNWECLLVDDGSTDETVQVIKDFVKKDLRFQLHSRPVNRPKGANACRNYGFEISKGDFVNWFDSDDLATPTFLEQRLELFQKDASLDMAACYATYFYDNGKPKRKQKRIETLSENPIENYILHGLSFYTGIPLWKKSYLLQQAEIFDETLQRSQERDFHFRLIFKGLNYKNCNDNLLLKRTENDSISTNSVNNLIADESVFKVRQRIFSLINSVSDKSLDKQRLIEYLFYRQVSLFYSMISISKDKKELQRIIMTYTPQIEEIVKRPYFSKNIYRRLKLGIWLVRHFKKGYIFFYYPQFNHRSY